MTALRIEVRVRGAGGGATPKKKGAELKGMAEAAVKQWRRSFDGAERLDIEAARWPRMERSAVGPADGGGSKGIPERSKKVMTSTYFKTNLVIG
jgi:hypothetical protein